MILKWTAEWYELDQTIIVGDKAWFSLPAEEKDHSFGSGMELDSKEHFTEKKLEIISITHPVLGDVRGIVTIGLDYTVYLASGEVLEVNAEEHPGQIYDSSYKVDDWTVYVKAEIIDDTADPEKNSIMKKPEDIVSHYKALLKITDAPWA